MTSPRNATTRPGGSRFYTWGGERYFSVTTIIGCLDKPALRYWAANEATTFALDNQDAWLPLLEKGDRAAAYDLVRKAPFRKSKKGADLGSAVHKAVEAYALGRPMPTWEPEVAGHMEQFEKFLVTCEPEFLMAEATVYNRTHKWAGTTDGVAVIGGKQVIIDYKTNNPNERTGHGIYPETALQLAAYAHAEFVGMPDGTEAPMPAVEEGAAVWLRPDEWALVPVRIDDEVYSAFRYVIEAFRWAEETSKTVLGKARTA